jgi:hypothetical protein
MRDLFAEGPGRAERMTAEAASIYLDHSKNQVTGETMRLLVDLAQKAGPSAPQRTCGTRGEVRQAGGDDPPVQISSAVSAGQKKICAGFR